MAKRAEFTTSGTIGHVQRPIFIRSGLNVSMNSGLVLAPFGRASIETVRGAGYRLRPDGG